jgi:5-methylcytosine-specific restriction endonuclease McrA
MRRRKNLRPEFRQAAREVVRFGARRFSAHKLLWIWSNWFLKSEDWKRLRYRALRRYGGRCMACGRSGKTATLNVDHVKPRRFYPELALDIGNLQVLCADCNRGKGNKDATDWRR